MVKDTAEIVKELKLCEEFNTFYDENKEYMYDKCLGPMLNDIIKKKGLKKTEIIRASQISEIYAYQILSGVRRPERNKLLCLIISMQISLEDAQRILRCAGYSPLYVKIPFDSVVIYGICNHLGVIEVNQLLFENNLETLG